MRVARTISFFTVFSFFDRLIGAIRYQPNLAWALARLVGMIPYAMFVYGVDETIASVGIFRYHIIRFQQPNGAGGLAHGKYRVVGALAVLADDHDAQVIGGNAQLTQQKVFGGGVVFAVAPALGKLKQGHPTISERCGCVGKGADAFVCAIVFVAAAVDVAVHQTNLIFAFEVLAFDEHDAKRFLRAFAQ